MAVLKAKVGALVAVIAAGVALGGLPSSANAQGLIDFLWGGEPEFGGSRQTVKFSPKYKAGMIIVSFGDRRLYLITREGQATSYPIAVPREQSRWEGATTVTSKRENPSWTPTPDMLKENPKLPSWVPGGHPMNPLGVRALYLGSSTYRIHGTDAPWTIGQAVSKGCIRMFNEDVLDLYPRIPVGTKVIVTWDKFETSGVESAEASPVEQRSASSASSSYKSALPGSSPAKASSSNPPKTGFFISSDREDTKPASSETVGATEPDEGLTQEEGATVYSRNPDGTYSKEESSAPPMDAPKKVTRYNRKVGGTVSRASQQATAVQ